MKQNTHILLTLTPELRLAQALKQAGVNDPATINKLVISGTLADDDFWYMHENMVETLQKLDIGNVIIRENGIGFPGFREFSALNSVILPDSLIWIGTRAFADCKSLTSFTIPSSVTEINCWAFSGCSGLTSVFIPESIIEIKYLAFDKCNGLLSFTVHPDNPAYTGDNGVLFNKDKTILIGYPRRLQDDYVIPESVIKIEPNALCFCSGLTAITIPQSTTEIIFNPDSSIQRTTFGGCTALTSITVHPCNPAYTSDDGVLYDKGKTKLICCPQGKQGDYIIPDSVFEIEETSFNCCYGLTSVYIPASVTKIHGDAFWDCPAFITVHPNNPVYKSVKGKLRRKPRIKKKQNKTNMGIKNGILHTCLGIKNGFFDTCLSMKNGKNIHNCLYI